jgi:cobalt-zinc-cadmium efflux system outer membrane protein
LINQKDDIVPVVAETEIAKYAKEIVLDSKFLQADAQINRPDYLMKIKNIEANEFNLKLQKSLAIPDVNIGLSYTQRGGAFDNQKNINLAIPLPLWNKNSGNIKFAQTILEESKADKLSFDLQLQTEIETSFSKWLAAKKNYATLKPTTKSNADLVYKGILDNFQKRNISLLEFTDFMESYSLSVFQINELQKKLAFAAEELNNTINKDLF